MHIKQITLHGFKSYGVKTTISGFDPHFNAITGLNGCGKSNILDAICFLLGQNAPTSFRVGNMQELVYKKGAGGISFASVTIVFDNSDKRQTPMNYSKYDEIIVERKIVMGPQGKSKFTINNSTATLAQVQDMFRSVQLNIQNPHFLIMQGKIVKVLNMRPEETWKMVEEAAGTMVYMNKRDSTLKVMDSKEKRIGEIDSCISTVVAPKLQRLQITRQNAVEFNRINREIEKKEMRKAAVDAYVCQQAAEKAKMRRANLKEIEKQLATKLEQLNEKLETLKAEIRTLERSDTNQSKELERLEEAAALCRRKAVELQSAIDANQNMINEERKLIADNRRDIAQKENQLKQTETNRRNFQQEKGRAEADRVRLETEVQRAQQALAVIVTGVGGQENADFGWKNQCQNAERELHELNRTLHLQTGNLDNIRKNLPAASRNQEHALQQHQALMNDMRRLDAEIADLEGQLAATAGANQEEVAELQQRKRQLLNNQGQVNHKIGQAEGEMSYIKLKYQNPGRGFDERKYLGPVANFFTVKDPDRFLAAIDACTGGKKGHFVVEDDNTASMLLNHGNIRNRVTILPLNRIRAYALSASDLAKVRRKVGENKAWSALELVDYDPRFEGVVKYAMGSTVICVDLDTANRIAFDRDLSKFCVTLDGDAVNPDGILSGGSRTPRERLLLHHVHQVKHLKQELEQAKVELQEVEGTLKELLKKGEKRTEIEASLHDKRNERNLLNHRCDQNSELRRVRDAQVMREDAEKLEKELEFGKEKQAELKEKIKDLKAKLSDKNAVEREKREADKNEAKSRDALKKHEEVMATIAEREAGFKAASDDMLKAVAELTAEIEQHERQIKTYAEANVRRQAEFIPAEEAHLKAHATFSELRNELSKKSVDLQNAQTAKRALEKEINKTETDREKATKEKDLCRAELEALQKKLNDEMFQQFPWLADEYHKLGTPESAYPGVESENPSSVAADIEKLKKRRTELQRLGGTEQSVDFDQIQRMYDDMTKKNDLCKADRLRLIEIIEQLDQKKQDLIELAVEEVNKHFGAIFKTLLPSADCKLEREKDEEGNPVEALKIRVALGNMWKESLAELSGGQRSLVALSLILAMLKMNPAPIYVLDEIDAALDLSHTHNVGRMIRKYFKQSQFIIVSLKEGMFTNANVLFRVTFQDGVSVVTAKRNRRDAADDDSDTSE